MVRSRPTSTITSLAEFWSPREFSVTCVATGAPKQTLKKATWILGRFVFPDQDRCRCSTRTGSDSTPPGDFQTDATRCS